MLRNGNPIEAKDKGLVFDNVYVAFVGDFTKFVPDILRRLGRN